MNAYFRCFGDEKSVVIPFADKFYHFDSDGFSRRIYIGGFCPEGCKEVAISVPNTFQIRRILRDADRFYEDYEPLLKTGESSVEMLEKGSDIVHRAISVLDPFMQPETIDN